MNWLRLIPAIPAALLFTGCAGDKASTEANANPFYVPPQLSGGGGGGDFGTPIKKGGNDEAAAAAAARAAGFNPDTDLAMTNPDNADDELPELQEIMARGPGEEVWIKSEQKALRESRKTGKPLLIWFTDSANSTASKTLSDNLLSSKDFEKWADENVVRMVVDQTQGSNIDDAVRKKVYARELKKKYNARGYPTLMVVSPSGEVIGRYTGYRRGKEDFIFGQVKQGVAVATENQRAWRASLLKKGYRDWSDARGRQVFAKLGSYNNGEMVLVEPDGSRARTHEKQLSAADRVWLQQQKEARGIH